MIMIPHPLPSFKRIFEPGDIIIYDNNPEPGIVPKLGKVDGYYKDNEGWVYSIEGSHYVQKSIIGSYTTVFMLTENSYHRVTCI